MKGYLLILLWGAAAEASLIMMISPFGSKLTLEKYDVGSITLWLFFVQLCPAQNGLLRHWFLVPFLRCCSLNTFFYDSFFKRWS